MLIPLFLLTVLTAAQTWTAWEYMGVHGGEYVAAPHTAMVVQCREEQEEILITVHVPHEEEGVVLKRRTLYVELNGSAARGIEKTEDRPFPGVFQFSPEEWFLDFLLEGGQLTAVFEGERMEVAVDGAFMKDTLDHCTGGTHTHHH